MTKRITAMFMCMLFGSLGAEEEAQTIISQAKHASQFGSFDAKALIQNLRDGYKRPTQKMSSKACKGVSYHQTPGQCGMTLNSQKPDKHLAEMFIFVSASMPQESLKALGAEAQKIGAQVVFRGLVGGTFPETQAYMKALRITAEIDPPKFDDYDITVIPSFVLAHNQKFDRVSGHISLLEALNQFRKKGDLKTEAQKLHQSLENTRR
jgi:type-F conjugative transfer system pilin assembly protein TrbC